MNDNGKREARHQSVSRRRLLKSGATVGVTSAGTANFAPAIVHAQNAGCGEFTLDKIKRTSQFSVGARQGVFPFGYLDKDNNDLLHDEVTTIDHALTRPWTVDRIYLRTTPTRWLEKNCYESNPHLRLGGEDYYLSADGKLMPVSKGQPPPDISALGSPQR